MIMGGLKPTVPQLLGHVFTSFTSVAVDDTCRISVVVGDEIFDFLQRSFLRLDVIVQIIPIERLGDLDHISQLQLRDYVFDGSLVGRSGQRHDRDRVEFLAEITKVSILSEVEGVSCDLTAMRIKMDLQPLGNLVPTLKYNAPHQ